MLPGQCVIFQTKIIILLERLQTEPIFKKEKQDDGLFSCFSPLFLNILSFFEKIYCLLWWRDARINNNTLWLRLYHSVEIDRKILEFPNCGYKTFWSGSFSVFFFCCYYILSTKKSIIIIQIKQKSECRDNSKNEKIVVFQIHEKPTTIFDVFAESTNKTL